MTVLIVPGVESREKPISIYEWLQVKKEIAEAYQKHKKVAVGCKVAYDHKYTITFYDVITHKFICKVDALLSDEELLVHLAVYGYDYFVCAGDMLVL